MRASDKIFPEAKCTYKLCKPRQKGDYIFRKEVLIVLNNLTYSLMPGLPTAQAFYI